MKFNEKHADMIACGVLFFFGTLFIVNEPSITGNVVGVNSGASSFGALFGLVFVVVAGLLFVAIYTNRNDDNQENLD